MGVSSSRPQPQPQASPSTDASSSGPQPQPQASPPTEAIIDFSKLTQLELRDHLKARGLTQAGRKADYVKRLNHAVASTQPTGAEQRGDCSQPPPAPAPQNAPAPLAKPTTDFSKLTTMELRALLKERGLPQTGHKSDYVKRLANAVDFNQFTVRQLSQALHSRGLNYVGEREELVERLTAAVGNDLAADSYTAPATRNRRQPGTSARRDEHAEDDRADVEVAVPELRGRKRKTTAPRDNPAEDEFAVLEPTSKKRKTGPLQADQMPDFTEPLFTAAEQGPSADADNADQPLDHGLTFASVVTVRSESPWTIRL